MQGYNMSYKLFALGSHSFHILQLVKYKSQFELIVKGLHVCTMQFALLKILLRPSQHWSWSMNALKIQVLIKGQNKWMQFSDKKNRISTALYLHTCKSIPCPTQVMGTQVPTSTNMSFVRELKTKTSLQAISSPGQTNGTICKHRKWGFIYQEIHVQDCP